MSKGIFRVRNKEIALNALATFGYAGTALVASLTSAPIAPIVGISLFAAITLKYIDAMTAIFYPMPAFTKEKEVTARGAFLANLSLITTAFIPGSQIAARVRNADNRYER